MASVFSSQRQSFKQRDTYNFTILTMLLKISNCVQHRVYNFRKVVFITRHNEQIFEAFVCALSSSQSDG